MTRTKDVHGAVVMTFAARSTLSRVEYVLSSRRAVASASSWDVLFKVVRVPRPGLGGDRGALGVGVVDV